MGATRFLSGVLAAAAVVSVARAAAADSRVSWPIVEQPAGVDGELVVRSAVGYRKGRPVKLQLVTLGWAEVEVRTARAFVAMREEAAESGIDLWINSGYRSHEQQAWLYQAWREGWGNSAARPGHSKHQSGRALDLDVRDPATYEWLMKNARRFGFRRTVAGEPWHWEYVRGRKRARRVVASRGQ
jgi:D-alanyl-D-alanine carboxypeptidase